MKKPKTDKAAPRKRREMTNLGKAVQHYLIDAGLTLGAFAGECGVNATGLSQIMVGAKPIPRGWITIVKLPIFLRQAAAIQYRDAISAEHEAVTNLKGWATDTPEERLLVGKDEK